MKQFILIILTTILFYHLQGQNKVGINTLIPSSNLSVKGNLSIGDTYAESTVAPDNGAIIEGKVGIGTDNPQSKLHIVGNTLIEGSLQFTNLGGSIFIGEEAGIMDDLNDNNNVYIGNKAGNTSTDAENNVAIGAEALSGANGSYNFALGVHALQGAMIGNDNVGIGNFAGFDLNGGNNILLGSGTGESLVGDNNVIIGRELGNNKTMDNKLWIDVENLGTPLVEGDFSSNTFKINGEILSSENIGAGTDIPLSKLDVNGPIGIKVKSGLESGMTNPDGTSGILIYTTNNGMVALPDATSCANRTYTIVNKTGSILPISNYIDMTNITVGYMAVASSIEIVSDGVDWQQIK
jgi:hypothetical protein